LLSILQKISSLLTYCKNNKITVWVTKRAKKQQDLLNVLTSKQKKPVSAETGHLVFSNSILSD